MRVCLSTATCASELRQHTGCPHAAAAASVWPPNTHQRRSLVSSGWKAVASSGPCLTATATLSRPFCAADSSAANVYSARTSTCTTGSARAGGHKARQLLRQAADTDAAGSPNHCTRGTVLSNHAGYCTAVLAQLCSEQAECDEGSRQHPTGWTPQPPTLWSAAASSTAAVFDLLDAVCCASLMRGFEPLSCRSP